MIIGSRLARVVAGTYLLAWAGAAWAQTPEPAPVPIDPALEQAVTGQQSMLLPTLVGVLFLIIGASFLFLGRRARGKAAAAALWPQVPAEVLASEVVVHPKRNSKSQTMYSPGITYRYAAGGLSFDADRVAFGTMQSASRGVAEKLVAKYPRGARISIHHNPENPAEAVIEPVAKGGLLMMIIGGLVLVLGIVMSLGGLYMMSA